MASQCIGSLSLRSNRVINALPGPLAVVPPRAPRLAPVTCSLQQSHPRGNQCMSILPILRSHRDRYDAPSNAAMRFKQLPSHEGVQLSVYRGQPCQATTGDAAGLVPEQRSDWEKFTETLTTLFPVWVIKLARNPCSAQLQEQCIWLQRKDSKHNVTNTRLDSYVRHLPLELIGVPGCMLQNLSMWRCTMLTLTSLHTTRYQLLCAQAALAP